MENKENKFDLFERMETIQKREEDIDRIKQEMKDEKEAIDKEMEKRGYVKVDKKEEKLDVDVEEEKKEKKVTKGGLNKFVAGILAGAALFATAGGAGYMVRGCEEDKNSKAALTPEKEYSNEMVLENEDATNIDKEIESIEFEEAIGARSEIEADRTYKFSQLVASINHYPSMEERDGLKYWDVAKSAGQITVTRPYGELHEENPHNEVVEFEFYPNDEQSIYEWNELNIGANVPAGAFWIETDTTGGEVKIEFFNENGEVIKRHEGEMVMAEWTDKGGETRHALQFKDNVSGETRPAAFQTDLKIFDDNGKAVDIEYPYHTAKVTFQPTPGSRMTLKTGPTIHFNPNNPYGPDHDQGFGFYLWDKEVK